jgi:hypothetical protein
VGRHQGTMCCFFHPFLLRSFLTLALKFCFFFRVGFETHARSYAKLSEAFMDSRKTDVVDLSEERRIQSCQWAPLWSTRRIPKSCLFWRRIQERELEIKPILASWQSSCLLQFFSRMARTQNPQSTNQRNTQPGKKKKHPNLY